MTTMHPIHTLALATLLAASMVSSAPGQATPINYGDALNVSLPAGATQSYQFFGTPGEEIIIMVTRTGGDFSFRPCIELLDQFGVRVQIACADSFINRIKVRLPGLTPAGLHRIIISDHPGAIGGGSYTLVLERVFPLPSPNCTSIAFDGNLTGSLNPTGDIDCFSFNVPANAPIRVTVIRLGGDFSFRPCIELFDPEGMPAGSACADSFINVLNLTTMLAGVHVILVREHTAGIGGGSYSIHLQCLAASCIGPAQCTSFGQGCEGSAGVPALDCTSLPVIGTFIEAELSSLPPLISNVPFLLFGRSSPNTDLSVIGMLGCTLLSSAEFAFTLNNTGGTASWSKMIPLDAALIGAEFFIQGAVLDEDAMMLGNILGVTTSNGVRLVIG